MPYRPLLLALPLLLFSVVLPAGAGDADRLLLEKVRKGMSKAGLDKGLFITRPDSGGSGVRIVGRVPNAEVKKRIVALARDLVGDKKLETDALWWPAFDMVIKTNLTTPDAHQTAYVDALRQSYLPGKGNTGEYTSADGPTGDGIVPFRVLIEHKTTVTFGDSIVGRFQTGTVYLLDKENVFGMPDMKTVAVKLGLGHQFQYTMTVRESGTIRYVFQKWEGDKYKDLHVTSVPITVGATKEVSVSEIFLGSAPAKIPPCPIDLKTARDRAAFELKPSPLNVVSAKCTIAFAGSPDALVKGLLALKPKEQLPVDVVIQNNSPWPMGSASFQLVDPVLARKTTTTYLPASVEFSPRLLPGEKRKVTGHLSARDKLLFSPFPSRTVSAYKLEPRFDSHGIVE